MQFSHNSVYYLHLYIMVKRQKHVHCNQSTKTHISYNPYRALSATFTFSTSFNHSTSHLLSQNSSAFSGTSTGWGGGGESVLVVFSKYMLPVKPEACPENPPLILRQMSVWLLVKERTERVSSLSCMNYKSCIFILVM